MLKNFFIFMITTVLVMLSVNTVTVTNTFTVDKTNCITPTSKPNENKFSITLTADTKSTSFTDQKNILIEFQCDVINTKAFDYDIDTQLFKLTGNKTSYAVFGSGVASSESNLDAFESSFKDLFEADDRVIYSLEGKETNGIYHINIEYVPKEFLEKLEVEKILFEPSVFEYVIPDVEEKNIIPNKNGANTLP